MKNNLFKSVLIFLITFTVSAKGYLNYTQAGDVFHLIDLLSKRYENESSKLLYKYWSKKFPLSLEDNNQLDNFKKIRSKYKRVNSEFDKFSLAFYRADSVDGAMKNLKKVIKKDELKVIVGVLRHFRPTASKIIGQSQGFKGKIALLDKALKKKKVFKAYENAFKFFGLKKNFKAKVYFLWWPESQEAKVEIVQNIVFIKVHPLKNIDTLMTPRFVLGQMVSSLFASLPGVHKENFEKTVFASCEKKNFYDVISYSMGHLAFLQKTQKKEFNLFQEHFPSKKDNIKSILFYELYQSELKQRQKFFGKFANQVKFICDQLSY